VTITVPTAMTLTRTAGGGRQSGTAPYARGVQPKLNMISREFPWEQVGTLEESGELSRPSPVSGSHFPVNSGRWSTAILRERCNRRRLQLRCARTGSIRSRGLHGRSEGIRSQGRGELNHVVRSGVAGIPETSSVKAVFR